MIRSAVVKSKANLEAMMIEIYSTYVVGTEIVTLQIFTDVVILF